MNNSARLHSYPHAFGSPIMELGFFFFFFFFLK
jgi:hypothetical protein